MKNVIILLMMSLLFIGCNGDDDATTPTEDTEVSLLGTWRFIEFRTSNDTGSNSGSEPTWDEIESENTISFFPNNTITSNSRSLCAVVTYMGSEPTSGVYNLVDFTYTSNDCANPDHKYPFTQTDSILVIRYPHNGIAECKFKKIADLEE
ncbi:hypothetical protein SCB49_05777 [unidentified eubacterium SCB49]|nr:hypothetical protein SCB49_05777 [unidentified eubacterium SCB49]